MCINNTKKYTHIVSKKLLIILQMTKKTFKVFSFKIEYI